MEEWRLERDADDQGTGGQDEGGGESNFGSGGDGDAASSQEKLGEEEAGKLRRTIGRKDPFQNKIGEADGGGDSQTDPRREGRVSNDRDRIIRPRLQFRFYCNLQEK